MRLSKELWDGIYNSLARFSEIHQKMTQVMQEGVYNNYKSDFNQFNQQDNEEDENIVKKTKLQYWFFIGPLVRYTT